MKTPIVVALFLLAGCARRTPPAAAPAAPAPDTLLVRLTPALSPWLALWRYADPEIEADSLARGAEATFTLRDIRHFDALAPGVRPRTSQLGVWAPDSLRIVEPDTAVIVANGFLKHVPPESPATAVLIDLQVSSIATLDTCAACEFDGAFWDGAERFGITGTTPPDTAGARCGFVRYFDLTSGSVTEFRTPPVVERAWRSYVVARESARAVRMKATAP